MKYLLLLFILIILSCSPKEEEQIMPIEGQIPDEQADSIRIIATTDSIIDYELTAVHMYKYYDTKQTFADTVFVQFYRKDGSIETTLQCDKAEIDDAKNTITGIGHVVVISENGTMKAPYAELDRNLEQITATKGVQLIRGENILYGEEMISDMRLDVVEITKVSGEGKLSEEDFDFQ